jgi:hypothetical protein
MIESRSGLRVTASMGGNCGSFRGLAGIRVKFRDIDYKLLNLMRAGRRKAPGRPPALTKV